MNPIFTWIQKTGAWIDRAILLRLLTRIHTLSGRAVRKRQAADWKADTLADFTDWLDSLNPNQAPDQALAPDTNLEPGPDLYTLLAEFTSLKKQIQLQNREQSRNTKGLKDFNEFAGRGRQIIDDLAAQIDRIRDMDEGLKEAARNDILQTFLDVRAPLARGAKIDVSSLSLFTGREKLCRLLEGYGIALRKFDQALARLDTVPMDTAGKPFDPEKMTAMDTCGAGSSTPGTVAEEISGGFMRRGQVLRTAGVVVYTEEKEK